MRLLDDDGENQAVRWFLACYGHGGSKTIGAMKAHLEMSGFDGCWPDWCNTEHPSVHLTKGSAQQWIRHLFSLEVQQVAVPDKRESTHLKDIYAFLESTAPPGIADEAFRNVPDSILPDSLRSEKLSLHTVKSDTDGKCLGLAKQDSDLGRATDSTINLSQQVAVPCKGKNCGSTNHKLHSAECFAEYERAIGQPQVAQVSQGYYCVACETHVSGACNSIDCPISDEAPPPQPEAQQVAVPVPLSDEQIEDMRGDANRGFNFEKGDYIKAIRDAEAHHGIGAKP
jgi:hypothetical protein